MDSLVSRFYELIAFNTQSNEACSDCPSTPGQLELARHLEQQLKSLQLEDINLDENGYLTACLPSNSQKSIPTIGFIAHLDTAPDFSGANVKAQLIENYQGQVIPLGDSGEILSPEEFPELNHYLGDTLITTDGTTLLGADNKAGVCEILEAISYLKQHPEIEHGPILLGFTPDEEIGRGADHFPMDRFPAKWAYTVDGGELGELEYENFNAATATVIIRGNNVHPGTAKGIMVNSQHLAARFHLELPSEQTPECTEGYQGFFHLIGTTGSVEQTTLTYIIRDFEMKGFAARKQLMEKMVAEFNRSEGVERFSLHLEDSYFNMRSQVEPHMHIVETARQAMENLDIKPKIVPIRGGTDGSRLSYMGLPCPNIFTGGHNFHGKHEYISVQSMHKTVATLVEIARLTAERVSD
ncbi:peptidase T [Dongshaea marina]|uniref:peptidase T n=1 Tax=Dongshaea marina TaxID=2047966 RepID=UPI000D3ED163|nr:peptidase T [Dongshaea marina]